MHARMHKRHTHNTTQGNAIRNITAQFNTLRTRQYNTGHDESIQHNTTQHRYNAK